MQSKHGVDLQRTPTGTIATCKACDFRLELPKGSDAAVVEEFQRACFAHMGVPVKARS
jgi:hypothetical protein